MNNEEFTDNLMHSLAHEVVCGRSVEIWARSNDVCALLARGWTERPEFRELVEKYRLEHAERAVGKIASGAERAIGRLIELADNADKTSVSLAASKAVIEKWIALSVYFVQEEKYRSVDARMKVLMAARAAEKRATGGGAWS